LENILKAAISKDNARSVAHFLDNATILKVLWYSCVIQELREGSSFTNKNWMESVFRVLDSMRSTFSKPSELAAGILPKRVVDLIGSLLTLSYFTNKTYTTTGVGGEREMASAGETYFPSALAHDLDGLAAVSKTALALFGVCLLARYPTFVLHKPELCMAFLNLSLSCGQIFGEGSTRTDTERTILESIGRNLRGDKDADSKARERRQTSRNKAVAFLKRLIDGEFAVFYLPQYRLNHVITHETLLDTHADLAVSLVEVFGQKAWVTKDKQKVWAPEFVEVLDRLCEHPNVTVREKALRVQITIDLSYISFAYGGHDADYDFDDDNFGGEVRTLEPLAEWKDGDEEEEGESSAQGDAEESWDVAGVSDWNADNSWSSSQAQSGSYSRGQRQRGGRARRGSRY
jgi:hypothetical protein